MASVEDEKNVPISSEVEENSGVRRTFVRVKRRIQDEPPSALILSFKRQRIEDEEKTNGEKSDGFEVVNNVLRFAGSIQHDQTLGSFVKGLDVSTLTSGDEKTGENLRLKSTPASSSVRRQRMHEEAKKKSSSCRYKIVSTKRGLDDESSIESKAVESEDEKYLYSMFELVEDELQGKNETKHSVASTLQDDVITCNGVPMVQTKSPTIKLPSCNVCDYIYDVYTIEKPLDVEDQDVNVEHLWDSQIVLDKEESDEEKYDNESDSNDENHPDNDYPDEVSDASDGEKYYGYDDDDLYKWSEDEEAYGDPDDGGGGSRAMKELAKHMRQVGLGARTESESSDN